MQKSGNRTRLTASYRKYWLAGITVIVLLWSSSEVRAARYAGEFLEIGIGARAMGMGGAFTALADDGSAFYWNPAGCARLYRMQITGMYAPLYGGIGSSLADYQHLGFTMPFSGSTVGVNWVRLSIADIPRFPDYSGLDYNSRKNLIIDADGTPTGYFSDTEEAVFISFARLNTVKFDLGWQYFVLPVEIPAGFNFKLIRQSLAGYSSTGIGADFGIQFRFNLNDILQTKNLGSLTAALNYQDFTRTGIDWGDNGSDAIPANLKWGLALKQNLPWINGALNLAYDQDSRWGGEDHYGLEFIFRKVLSFRAGHEYHGWTAGAGGMYNRVIIDYAFLNTDIGAVNRISGTYIFP